MKLIFPAVMAVSLSLLVVSPAAAQLAQRRPQQVAPQPVDPQRVRQVEETVQQRRQAVGENATDLRANRCQRIAANAQQHLESIQDHRLARQNRYRHILNLLETVIQRADQANLDTTELKRVQTELQQQIDVFVADFDQVVAAAQALRLYECGETEGDLVRLVENLKSTIRTSQASSAQVKDYYQNTVKPALRALKAQAAS